MKRQLLLLCILILAPSLTTARIWYVTPDGTGDAPSIQAGIDSAAVGDSVVLADGTYSGDGNRDLDYQGKAIAVVSEHQDPDLCIIDCGASPDSSHRGFTFTHGETIESLLEGVTISNGCWYDGDGQGGGIYCWGSSPEIRNVVIRDNTASGEGGGVVCRYESSPLLTDVQIIRNSALVAGGMWIQGNSCPVVTRVRFEENSAGSGGMGGGLYSRGCHPVLEQVEFIGNTAERVGGGMYCDWGCGATLTHCTFINNSAVDGGGMACQSCSPILSDVIFTNNSADSWGGGMRCNFSSPLVERTVFSGNTASSGGGFYSAWESDLVLTRVTLVANHANWAGGVGTAQEGGVTLNACIVASNTGGGGLKCDVVSWANLQCCDVYGNVGGDWVSCIADQYGINGNISEDPLLCGPEEGNFYLDCLSPCVYGYGCGQIGAYGVGCGASGTEPTTWGMIKSMYR